MATTEPSVRETVSPEEVGLDPGRVGALVERARREVDEGLLPSCQLALAKDGRLVVYETFGDAAPGSRYVIFSCTKGLIAGAMWLLIGEGLVGIDERVAEIVPEFGTNGKDVITVEQLLTHTSGFPYAPLDFTVITTREQRLAKFEQWRLNWEPGTKFEYHPTSAHWVLAEIIERVSGTDYRDFVWERILDPLGLQRFRLGVPPGEQGDINELVSVGELPTPDEIEAAIGIRVDIEDMLGEVTQDALLSFNDPSVRAIGVPGGGGISDAADLALYYQALLHNTGELWDPDVLADGTGNVRCMLPDPLRGIPAHRSLGLMIAGDPETSYLRGFGHGISPRAFGHDGAGGQIAWADPETGISFGYLTNGLDMHVIRQGRRSIGISSRAAAAGQPATPNP